MNSSLLFDSILSPPILFFLVGVVAAWIRSDLEIPQPIAKFLSVYLLAAIGFQGGVKLSQSSADLEMLLVIGLSLAAAMAIPCISFFILRLRLDAINAGAIAAAYGSISVVTFVTAAGCLQSQDIAYSGHMVAAMAMMEFPAIVVGVMLARKFHQEHASPDSPPLSIRNVFVDACRSGPVILLAGCLLAGLATGERGWASLESVMHTPFRGALAFFLLEMGLQTARCLNRLPQASGFLLAFAVAGSVLFALAGLAAGSMIGLGKGDALLLAVLFGSASYIAAPAAIRLALPEANPGYYLSMSLGVTFPFNVTFGIPMYLAIIQAGWGG